MPSSLVTSLLWQDSDETLVAKVLGAEPSTTTYLLGCTPEPDGRECGLYVTLTLGPWASETPPPGADRTGDFDLYITDPVQTWKFSAHCEMSGTVAKRCTTINIGGNDDGHPTATLKSHDDLEWNGFDEFGYAPVTITEGLELLAATHSGSHETASGQATSESAPSATAASSETSTTDSSSGTSTPEATSAASSSIARGFIAATVAAAAMQVVL